MLHYTYTWICTYEKNIIQYFYLVHTQTRTQTSYIPNMLNIGIVNLKKNIWKNSIISWKKQNKNFGILVSRTFIFVGKTYQHANTYVLL